MASGSVNKVILVGNLGRDAELRATPGGLEVISFSVATTERKRDRETNQWTDQVEWHRVKMFRDTQKSRSTVHEYLKKGQKVYVEGRLQTRSWDDKDGQKKYLDRDHLGSDRAARPEGRRARAGAVAANGTTTTAAIRVVAAPAAVRSTKRPTTTCRFDVARGSLRASRAGLLDGADGSAARSARPFPCTREGRRLRGAAARPAAAWPGGSIPRSGTA